MKNKTLIIFVFLTGLIFGWILAKFIYPLNYKNEMGDLFVISTIPSFRGDSVDLAVIQRFKAKDPYNESVLFSPSDSRVPKLRIEEGLHHAKFPIYDNDSAFNVYVKYEFPQEIDGKKYWDSLIKIDVR